MPRETQQVLRNRNVDIRTIYRHRDSIDRKPRVARKLRKSMAEMLHFFQCCQYNIVF